MATYEITSPTGEVFEVTAPEGATESQVLDYAQGQFAQMHPPQGTPSPMLAPPISGAGVGGGDLQWSQPGYQEATAPRRAAAQDIPISDVPGMAAQAIPASAAQFAKDIATPFMEPVKTAESLGDLAMGTWQRLGAQLPGKGRKEQREMSMQFGKFLKDRYGGIEEAKRTLATDPVGALADAATILTGGGASASRLPGVAGKAARAVGRAGAAADPLALAARGAGAAAKGAGKVTTASLGTLTGAGPLAIEEAARAGARGGGAGEAFLGQLREMAPVERVVDDAKTALNQMKSERAQAYRAGMDDVARDAAVIDLKPITDSVGRIMGAGEFKGQTIRPKAAQAADEIASAVDEWARLDPTEFHTPEGLDALKQKIYDIGASYDPMTQKQARMVADQVRNTIKDEIVRQAPEYAKVMKGYEEASSLIADIEKTLSVNPKANVDTTIRKLQSVMRNNAATNYGKRVDLARKLEGVGASELMPRLSGQALSSTIPRGLQGAGTGVAGLGIGAGVASGTVNPAALALLPATSPRAVGETAYYAGKAGQLGNRAGALANQMGLTRPASRLGAYQLGRLTNELVGP